MGDPVYDVFLSHNSADKPAIEQVAARLLKTGIRPWFDKWNLIPGRGWQEAVEQALDECRTCAVFIGPNGAGAWQTEEMRAAIGRRVMRSEGNFRVIPVLLPGAKRPERTPFLYATTWVEFYLSIDEDEPIHRLICGIKGVEPGPQPPGSMSAPCEWIIVLSATVSDANRTTVDAILDHLRKLSGDSTLTVKKVSRGSVVLRLKGTINGFEKILALYDDALLTELLGFRLIEVRLAASATQDYDPILEKPKDIPPLLMTAADYVALLREGVGPWNQWRQDHPFNRPVLRNTDLTRMEMFGVDLSGADLREVNLEAADLTAADLYAADLRSANLRGVNMSEMYLGGISFGGSDLSHANLSQAVLHRAIFNNAKLEKREAQACIPT